MTTGMTRAGDPCFVALRNAGLAGSFASAWLEGRAGLRFDSVRGPAGGAVGAELIDSGHRGRWSFLLAELGPL